MRSGRASARRQFRFRCADSFICGLIKVVQSALMAPEMAKISLFRGAEPYLLSLTAGLSLTTLISFVLSQRVCTAVIPLMYIV